MSSYPEEFLKEKKLGYRFGRALVVIGHISVITCIIGMIYIVKLHPSAGMSGVPLGLCLLFYFWGYGFTGHSYQKWLKAEKEKSKAALNQFEAGKPLLYEEILFKLNGISGLEVMSFSTVSKPELVTVEMAMAGIEHSKKVLAALSAEQPKFSALTKSLPTSFLHCTRQHAGAVVVAYERNDQFNWGQVG